MAEIQGTPKDGKRKTQAPRVDLTPMVDLGFILITFFMYSTTLLESRQLKMDIPVPTPHSRNEIPLESTLTFFLVDDHKLVYYEGIPQSEADYEIISMSQLRHVIQQKQSAVKQLPATYSKQAHQLHVLIKPHDRSTYEDLVSIIDEMLINNVPYYAIVDITEEEQNALTGVLPELRPH